MILERLHLHAFRPHRHFTFEPSPGINLLVGPNGSGKTAILEAISMLSAVRSFRARHEHEVITWGESSGGIEGHFSTDRGHHRELSLIWERLEGSWTKSATLQGDRIHRLADFLGCVPSSLFTPEDLQLIAGSPALRRRYLDLQLSKINPAHLLDLAQLKKVLGARNALLRQGRHEKELLPWNQLLYQLSLQVGKRREDLTQELNILAKEYHHHLVDPQQELCLRYRRSWPTDADLFYQRLRELSAKERQAGLSLISPQKDDLEIRAAGRSLRLFGSQGEQRTVALCLRLAQARTLEIHQNEKAILLLDDVLSELDEERRHRLITLLPSFAQVLMTSAVSELHQVDRVTVHELKKN